ncbi:MULTISPECIES: DUF3575 domain-containing protein [Chitinophagaceae]|uniref:DUF3575 domain-containing protein n=1 Tax=Chitinophagaceae TaxID=563835 RepID=UPI000DEF8AD2|nr:MULTISPECIES: DUF3575 domain-containing protein [Chitinophagaceae]RPD44404.1 DUF3575 domain-containing protein [Paracnuella aquatica]
MMYLKKLAALLLAFSTTQAFAQEGGAQVENVTRFTFISPGFGHEQRVGKNTTLVAHAYLSPYASIFYSNAFGEESFNAEFRLETAVSLQYRYYYNFARRQEKGQRTAKNSMNYIAPKYTALFTNRRMSSAYLPEENSRAVNTLGVVWGLQRNLPGRLSLDFNAGLGYQFAKGHTYNDMGMKVEKSYGDVAIMSGITLGIWLGKKEAEQ